MSIRHHIRTDRFFSREEKEAIKKCAIEAESKTIGEIAVMVVDHSSLYLEAEITGGVLSASLVSLVATEALFSLSEPVAEFFFYSSIWLFIPLALALFFPARLLFKAVPSLKYGFISQKRMEKAVKERALRAFYEKGLYKTRENSGMLFFLSLFERKVWVLADKGIHGKIHQHTLNNLAAMVSKGIREKRACAVLSEAILEAGSLLAKHYPATAGHVDQLPNGVIFDSGREVE